MNFKLLVALALLLVGLAALGSALWFSDGGYGSPQSPRRTAIDTRGSSKQLPSADGLRTPASETATPEPVERDVPAPEVTALEERSPQELWEEKYKDASASELDAAIKTISQEIHSGSVDELKRRHDLGLHEHIGNGSKVPYAKVDHELITSVLQKTDGNMYRTILPQGEFPELYQLKAEQLWLREKLHERRVQEVTQRRVSR